MKKAISILIFSLIWWLSVAQTEVRPTLEASLVNIVENTIARSPIIQRQQLEISRSQADLQNTQGAFDLQLNSELRYFRSGNQLLDSDPRSQVFDNVKNRDGQFRVGVQKTFRNSMTVQTGVDWTRKSNSTPFDEFQQPEAPYFANNTGNFSVNFLQPLLKGRGREVATANERASNKIVEAQERNLLQVAAREVHAAVSTYWQYVATFQIMKVYEQNESRVKRLLEITETLIDADKKPYSELIQVKADLAEKEGQTIRARQNYYQVQQQLQRIVGLNAREGLGLPLDKFPSPDNAGFSNELFQETFHEIALEKRTDLKALQLNQAALSEFLLLSENALKPQLDLGGVVGYGGLKKGDDYGNLLTLFGEEAGSRWNAGISLSYLFPLQNNRAKAQLSIQKIALQDQAILLENEARNIKINLNVALNNLKLSYASLRKSEETFNYYLIAFDNEQEKFKNGLTTLINVIIFQERLTFAEIQYIQFQQQFAIDLATLRFETGTIMQLNYFQAEGLSASDFYQIPKG